MNTPPPKPVIFFDLDNTLSNHTHASRVGIESIVSHCPLLVSSEIPIEKIFKRYNECLKISYNGYLVKRLNFEESQALKVELFWAALKLPKPTPEDHRRFKKIYTYAYRANLRPTAESIDTLKSLMASGFRIAIIMNGLRADQEEITEGIGLANYVERVFTSEEAGAAKPDAIIFRFALDKMGVNAEDALMVGNSVREDIKGAIGAGMKAVLYDPSSESKAATFNGTEVPIIKRMEELLKVV